MQQIKTDTPSPTFSTNSMIVSDIFRPERSPGVYSASVVAMKSISGSSPVTSIGSILKKIASYIKSASICKSSVLAVVQQHAMANHGFLTSFCFLHRLGQPWLVFLSFLVDLLQKKLQNRYVLKDKQK